MLTNLETNQRKLLQVVMIGQPELRELLAEPQLRQLSQRITARYHLGPLSKEEVPDYINYRLSVAGAGRNRLFPPATVRKIYGLTKGIPRLINVLCDRALLGAFVLESERVDVKTLKRAAREVLAGEDRKGKNTSLYRVAAGVLVLLCIGLGILYYAPGLRQWASGRLHTLAGRLPVGPKATLVRETAPAPTAKVADSVKAESVGMATLSRPAGHSGHGIREMAYRALFRQWHAPYHSGQDRLPLCDQAASAGLGCLVGKGGISTLSEMNRPAVLAARG